MTPARIVIVGAGQGGFQAAMSLRQEGFAGEITLIGAESGLPYQRPPLSKTFIKTGEAAKLALRPRAFFDKNEIRLVTQTKVEELDRVRGEVRTAGGTFRYDHLILATGAGNIHPPIPGLDRALALRTLDDAAGLRGALPKAGHIAIIGGGFIGLELAAVLRALGHRVTIVEAADRLMARAVSPVISSQFQQIHEASGTQIILGCAVTSISPSGIELADGAKIDADMVVAAIGVRPRTGLAEAAGLEIDNGIRVDSLLLTSDPQISALGDCASFPDPRNGRHIRLESVQAATDHARLIAKRIAHGRCDPYAAIPWFWSDQGSHKLQIAGLSAPSDDSVAAGIDTVFRFDKSILTAVETINNPNIHMKARKLMAEGRVLTRDKLEDVAYDLAAL